jgi:hypothetical protein
MSDKKKSVDGNDYGWPGDERVRRKAVVNFLDKLKGDPTLIKKCCDPKDPTAKQVFLSAGGYTGVPSDVAVRVFELEEEGPGDKLVTLVLPKNFPNDYDPDSFNVHDVWVCTYILWVQAPTPPPHKPIKPEKED